MLFQLYSAVSGRFLGKFKWSTDMGTWKVWHVQHHMCPVVCEELQKSKQCKLQIIATKTDAALKPQDHIVIVCCALAGFRHISESCGMQAYPPLCARCLDTQDLLFTDELMGETKKLKIKNRFTCKMKTGVAIAFGLCKSFDSKGNLQDYLDLHSQITRTQPGDESDDGE